MEAGDGEQVGRAGAAEVFLEIGGEVVAIAEKEGLGDGGLGFGEGASRLAASEFLKVVDGGQNGASRVLLPVSLTVGSP